MVLFGTSDASQSSQCFITTTNIDGETDVKTKSSLHLTSQRSSMYLPPLTIRIASVLEEHPVILCEAENATTSSFHGVLQFAEDGSLEHISISSLLLRGCRLVFTGRFSPEP